MAIEKDKLEAQALQRDGKAHTHTDAHLPPTLLCIHAHTHTRMHTHIHANSYTHVHTHSPHTHAHTHTQAHTRTVKKTVGGRPVLSPAAAEITGSSMPAAHYRALTWLLFPGKPSRTVD